jgi:hypothetical protein
MVQSITARALVADAPQEPDFATTIVQSISAAALENSVAARPVNNVAPEQS